MAGKSFGAYAAMPAEVFLKKAAARARRYARKITVALRGHLGVSEAGFYRAVRKEFLEGRRPRFFRREKGQGPKFFFDSSQASAIASRARALFPGSEKAVFSAAEDILSHHFDLLGSGKKFLGDTIDWHVDMKSGYRWEPVFFADITASLPPREDVDIKGPWELSRFQHLPTLGQAYWFSLAGRGQMNPARYGREFVLEIRHWIEKNPPGVGVNWACTMDVAIRAVNWLWGYYFLCGSPSLTEDFHRAFFKSLLEHGRFIRTNLEDTDGLTANHYLAGIVGLVFLGVLLPEFAEAEEWRTFAAAELEKEMRAQVYPDGMDFEGSIPYHRLALELFSTAYHLLALNGYDMSPLFRERLEHMFAAVMAYTRPDGLAPQIGDADDGRLQILSGYPRWERRDHRYLLALGGRLFRRPDMAAAGAGHAEEAFYLLNGSADTAGGRSPEPGSAGIKNAGIYIMRHKEMYAIMDCGPHGQRGRGGHAHNDTLSVEIFSGEPFIIDPGSYIYTPSEKWRNTFRSTASHNRVMVDGEEINVLPAGDLFRLEENAVPSVRTWTVTPQWDFLAAGHAGYGRLTPPVNCCRQVFFQKKRKYWVIRDLITHSGGGASPETEGRTLDLLYHFHSGIRVARIRSPLTARAFASLVSAYTRVAGEQAGPLAPVHAVRADGARGSLLLCVLAGRGAKIAIDSGWVSPRYGVKKRAPVLRIRKVQALPAEFLTLILPGAAVKK